MQRDRVEHAPIGRGLMSLLCMGAYAYLAGFSREALELRRSGFNLLRDISVEKLERSALEFLQENQSSQFRIQAAPLIEAHRKQGCLIVLLTSACEPLAHPVATKLNCDAIIATRLLANHNHYTGERVLPEPYGAGKRLLVEQFCEKHSIFPGECFAYADHHSDSSLLEFVGHPSRLIPRASWNPLQKQSTGRLWIWTHLQCQTLTFPKIFVHVSQDRHHNSAA